MNDTTPAADLPFVRPVSRTLDVDDRDESQSSLELQPPSASRGDHAMQSRIAARLFGDAIEPQWIAHYEIIRRVGVGGMGVVYAARDTKLDREVALKQVRRNKLSEHERARLIAEARALAKLSHPNVVQVFEVGEHDGDVYVAMELVDGQTLAEWQRDRKPLWAILERYTAAGAGLHAAHAAGLVHRDFKPANVLIGNDGRVRVVDFGLALPAADEGASTLSSTDLEATHSSRRVAGTPGYIAPELLEGAPPTRASDIYSFCVSLQQAIDGAGQPTAIVPTSRRGRSSVPRWLESILARGLAPDPAQRWPSMQALLDELERRPKRRRQIINLALALGLLLAGSTFVSLWAKQPELPAICERPQEQIEQLWNPQRHAQLRDRLRRTKLPEPDQTAGTVGQTFDRFAREWVATRERVCADRMGQNRSTSHFDLANECLDRTLHKARMLLDTIESGDLRVQERVTAVLAELGDPERCRQSAEFGLERPPLDLRGTVARARQSLDAAQVDISAGRFDDAQLGLDELASSDAIERFAPLRAEFTLARGRLLIAQQRADEALDAFTEAAALAEQHQLPGILFEARREIIAVEVRAFERGDAARRWLTLLSIPAQVLDSPESRIELLEAQAEVEELTGQLAHAEATLGEALGLAVTTGDEVAERDLRLRLANVIAERGRTHDALREYAALERDWKHALGHHHPALGALEFDIGLALLDAGELEGARQHLEAALEIQQATHGADSPKLAPVLTVLASIASDQGRHLDAIPLAERAWAMQSQALPKDHSERGTALLALGWAQVQTGQLVAGLATHELIAIEFEDRLSPIEAAKLHETLGWLRCRVDDCRGAEPHYELALITGNELTKLQAELGLANVELADGRAHEAVATIEEVLPQLQAWSRDEAPESAALAQWMLARALVESGEPRSAPRVQALAKAAEQAYRELPPRADIAADLEELLATSTTLAHSER